MHFTQRKTMLFESRNLRRTTMVIARASALLLLLMTASGCGDRVPGKSGTAARAGASQKALRVFADCVRGYQLRVRRTAHVPFRTVERAPHPIVPATYFGTVQMSPDSVADIWIAGSNAEARKSAEVINEIASRQRNEPVEVVEVSRHVVAGLSYSSMIVPRDADHVDRCSISASAF